MRILVTGNAGFLGRHLTRRLLAEGHEVVGVDNFATTEKGVRPPDVPVSPRFQQYDADIVDWPVEYRNTIPFMVPFPSWMEWDIKFDQIYHLACPASPPHYQRRPLETLMTSVLGTRRVMDIAACQGGCRVLLTSTSEVYGDPLEHPQKESYRGNVNIYGPRSMYDVGKMAAETVAWIYRNGHLETSGFKGTDVRIARIFNVFGPGMALDDGRAIPNFVTQALRGERLTVYGDGSQTRSLCYVDDMIEGLVRLMNVDPNPEGPVNLGNPHEVTLKHLAHLTSDLARDVTGRQWGDGGGFQYEPLPQDDPTRRCPDITRAKAVLGWEPKVGLEEGLRRTITDFAQRLGVPAPANAGTGGSK